MTTATATFSWSNASAASTKLWIDGVRNLLLAAGLVASTDTGQLDTTAITVAPSYNTGIGFQLFKFPDTLQASAPIVIRVEYRTDNNTRPVVAYTVGSVTDGAGTVGSPTFVKDPSVMDSYQASLTSYACYVDGTFSMVLGYAYSSTRLDGNCVASLVVDRSRTAAGVATATGFLCEGTASGYGVSRSLYGAASPATATNFIPSLIPSYTATSSSEGADVNVFRHYMMVPGVRPSLGCLTYFTAEFGALSPFTATVLGAAHTWLPMGVAMNHWSAAYTATTSVIHCGAMRWE